MLNAFYYCITSCENTAQQEVHADLGKLKLKFNLLNRTSINIPTAARI